MANLSAESTTCTAVKPSGKFCDRESLPDAPFPMCVWHAAEILRYLNSCMPKGDGALAAARGIERDPVEPVLPPCDDTDLVYYVRIGDHIKVGHSTNLTQRMRSYPPDAELMAFEPGDRALEAKRLRQFRDGLRMKREWFRPTAALLAHIEQVREQFVD